MTKREVRARRGARIALPAGPAGQTSGETVAAALARKRRQTSDVDAYEQLVGRYAGVAVRAAQLLWTAAVGTDLPTAAVSAVERVFTGDAPVMPSGLTARIVHTELGGPPDEVFAEFDPVPFATGPLCQVHAAVLPDGRRVAVRIRYRGVAQALRNALAGGEVRAIVDPLALAAAPDLTATDLQRAASALRGRVEETIGLRGGAERDRIPDVVPELSTQRVLTLARADGPRPWDNSTPAWKAARMGETR